MDIEIKILSILDIEEFSQLIKVFAEVFGTEKFNMPANKHLQYLLSKSDFFVIAAKSDHKIVGGLTVYILDQYYSTKPLAYIYDVGILPDHQRKGIGKKLITYLTDYCKKNNFAAAYVEAETDDHQAVNFYRSTKVDSELQATHFTYSFDESNPNSN